MNTENTQDLIIKIEPSHHFNYCNTKTSYNEFIEYLEFRSKWEFSKNAEILQDFNQLIFAMGLDALDTYLANQYNY